MEKSIEELLLKASEEPEYREAFYEKLLESEVFVLGGDDASVGEDIADSETISLLEWESAEGERAIPFFTTYDLLEKAVGEDHLYLPLQASVLFATVPDMNLVMNPGFDASKMFTPEEIQMVLSTQYGEEDEGDDGEGAEFSEDISLKPITSNRSVKMLKALKALFVKETSVKLAYVAEMAERDENDTLQLAIGVEIDGEEGELFSYASDIVLELAENESVDLFKINRKEKEGMSAYFIHEMKPFYIRK